MLNMNTINDWIIKKYIYVIIIEKISCLNKKWLKNEFYKFDFIILIID